MTTIRAVAFDFDDTISDWPAAVARAASLLELELSPEAGDGFAERFLEAVAVHYPSRIPGPLFFEAHVPIGLANRHAADANALAERFRSLMHPVAFDDAQLALEELSTRFPLAILSNNPYAPEALRLLGMAGHFASVITFSETDEFAKPHANAFAALAAGLDLPPAAILYVGDSITHDVEGALAAGMPAAWLDRFGWTLEMPEGAHRITSLAELAGLVGRM